MMSAFWRLFRSARLALGLLFGLALLAGIGSLPRHDPTQLPIPGATDFLLRFIGIKNTFASPLFLTVVALLLMNVIACTAHRVIHHKRRKLYQVLDLLMHLALVVLVVGSVLRVVKGDVGTLSIGEGQEASEMYDWGSRRPVPLDSPIRVVRMVTEFYPMLVRVGVRDLKSNERIALLEILEGKEQVTGEANVSVRLLGADRVEGRVGCLVRTPAGEGRIRLDLRSGPGATAEYGGYGFTLVAFRDETKMVRALLSTRQKNGQIAEQWLAPNERVRIGGKSVFLTAWKTDPFGSRFAGLQVTKDPGAPVFWAGCLLFVATLAWRSALKFRGRV